MSLVILPQENLADHTDFDFSQEQYLEIEASPNSLNTEHITCFPYPMQGLTVTTKEVVPS